MNPYSTPASSRPWWKTTPAALGVLALVFVVGAFSFGLGFLVMIAAVVAVWGLPPWRWLAKLGATFGALLLLTIGAGLGGQLDDSGAGKADAKGQDERGAEGISASPTMTKPVKIADFVGQPLDDAEARARSVDYTPGHHDASDEGRAIILRSGWMVCFQKADLEAKTIDFAAVKRNEPCPAEDGGSLPWPKMPDVVGTTYNTAIEDLKQASVRLDRVTLDDVYLDLDAPTAKEAAEDGDEWRVCFQSPEDRAKVTPTTTVRLDLGRWTDADLVQRCPSAKDTTYKIPATDPDYDSDDSSTGGGGSADGDSSSTSSGGSTGGTVHPGSFCSPRGATGATAAGTPMVCGPGSDGRNRWRSA